MYTVSILTRSMVKFLPYREVPLRYIISMSVVRYRCLTHCFSLVSKNITVDHNIAKSYILSATLLSQTVSNSNHFDVIGPKGRIG